MLELIKEFNFKIPCHSPKSIQFIKKNIDLSSLNLLNIKWLSLQNHITSFSPQKPRLPGQKYPGSRIGRSVLIIIRRICILNHRDGILNVPEHFHNAFLYQGFVFIDPEVQGSLEKMKNLCLIIFMTLYRLHFMICLVTSPLNF